ncbi:MAG: response regulator [Chitinophagaceae bacterium]|nr:response regulator [Anaerolineae bacterium]
MSTSQRILVVEDDPDGQALVAHVLGHINIPIDLAGDADQASSYLFGSGMAYRAVIIDLALPGRDGWELLAEIQGDERTQGLPCIAVTAFHTSKIREEAIKAGFTAYFPKPIDAMTFARELEALL